MSSAIEILRREREQAKEQIRMLNASVRDLENAIALLELHDSSATSRKGTAGDLIQRVSEILIGAGPKGASPQEIAETLTAQGRQTTSASVSSTLSRMKNSHGVTNRQGQWFTKNAGPEIPISEAANGLAETEGEGRKPTHPRPSAQIVETGRHLADDLDDEIPF